MTGPARLVKMGEQRPTLSCFEMLQVTFLLEAGEVVMGKRRWVPAMEDWIGFYVWGILWWGLPRQGEVCYSFPFPQETTFCWDPCSHSFSQQTLCVKYWARIGPDVENWEVGHSDFQAVPWVKTSQSSLFLIFLHVSRARSTQELGHQPTGRNWTICPAVQVQWKTQPKG